MTDADPGHAQHDHRVRLEWGPTGGITVIPYRWGDEGAVSLSPVSLETVDGLERLVLPSPNGSTICAVLAETGR